MTLIKTNSVEISNKRWNSFNKSLVLFGRNTHTHLGRDAHHNTDKDVHILRLKVPILRDSVKLKKIIDDINKKKDLFLE